MKKLKLPFLVILLSMLFLSGCDSALIASKGAVGKQQFDLIVFSTVLMLLVVVPVIVLTLYFAWRYRSGNTKSTYTPEWSHSTKLELVVWLIPVAIILILGYVTWVSTHDLDPAKPLAAKEDTLTVEVVSLDWKWLFIYPEQNIATINELVFPANKAIKFKITSHSVMNSFFIPRLGSQIYAMAGMETKLNLIADEPGRFKGISAGYSGEGFSDMKFTATAVESEQSFDKWVEKVKSKGQPLVSKSDLDAIYKPSVADPVQYFSTVTPNLFRDIILKFKPWMAAHEGVEEGQMARTKDHQKTMKNDHLAEKDTAVVSKPLKAVTQE